MEIPGGENMCMVGWERNISEVGGFQNPEKNHLFNAILQSNPAAAKTTEKTQKIPSKGTSPQRPYPSLSPRNLVEKTWKR